MWSAGYLDGGSRRKRCSKCIDFLNSLILVRRRIQLDQLLAAKLRRNKKFFAGKKC